MKNLLTLSEEELKKELDQMSIEEIADAILTFPEIMEDIIRKTDGLEALYEALENEITPYDFSYDDESGQTNNSITSEALKILSENYGISHNYGDFGYEDYEDEEDYEDYEDEEEKREKEFKAAQKKLYEFYKKQGSIMEDWDEFYEMTLDGTITPIPVGMSVEEFIETMELCAEEYSYYYDGEVLGDESEPESPETILQKQILVKKIQAVLDGLKNNTSITQRIEDSDIPLLSEVMISDANPVHKSPALFDAINQEQYEKDGTIVHEYFQELYRVSDDKMLSIEFFYKENYGIISIQDHDKEYLYVREEEIRDGRICQSYLSEDIFTVEELENSYKGYRTEESLRELLEKKLAMKNEQLSSLEAQERTIAETEALVERQAGKDGSDKGEK